MLRPVAFAAIAVCLCPRAAVAAENPFVRMVNGLTARSLGPVITGGRITDLAVVESEPNVFYVAAAFGKPWTAASDSLPSSTTSRP